MAGLQHFKMTRIAPTPSGYLHLGNLFSFALTAALAHESGAGTRLRIDDLDAERTGKPYLEDIFETLAFMNIRWTHGPRNLNDFEQHYRQQLRLPLYEKTLQELRDRGLVYACDCSRSKILAQDARGWYPGTCRHKGLSLDTPGLSWRLHTEGAIVINMRQLNGVAHLPLPAGIRDVVIRKKDGFPAYQVVSLVNDEQDGTDLVVRGADLLPSSLVQLYLASLLGVEQFTQTTFVHHRLFSDEQRRKLSKSAGAYSVKAMRGAGLDATEVYKKMGEALNLKTRIQGWEDLCSLLRNDAERELLLEPLNPR